MLRKEEIQNMKKRNRWIILLFSCFIAIRINIAWIQAGSATITLESTDSEVERGDMVSVVLSIESEGLIGEFESYLYYDSEILEFVSGGKYINGGEGTLLISDRNNEAVDDKKTYSLQFKAIDTGVATIQLMDKPRVYDYEEKNEMSVSSTTISISVKSSKKLSDNSNLTSLKVSPGMLEPNFSKDTIEYQVTVDSGVSELVVSASPQIAESTVSVEGNKNLTEGENSISIIVKAPSGNTKTYHIIVTKLPVSEEKEEEEKDKENSIFESTDTFEIKQKKKGNISISNEFEYKIIELENENLVPKGYEKTQLILYGISVPAYMLSDNMESDFILFYAENKEGERGFYQYDRREKTMQRYSGIVLDSAEIEKSTLDSANLLSSKEYNEKLQELAVIIAVLAGLMVVFAIGMIVMFLKWKANQDDFD